MTKTKKIYSKTTNEQPNPNRTTPYNAWKNMQNAVGNTSTVATGKYTRKREYRGGSWHPYLVNPQTVAIADFRITTDDIPKNAYINSVTIYVGLSCDKSLKVKAPVGSFMIYNGKGKVTQTSKKGKTGWYNSTYRIYPSTKLTTSNKDIAYTIPGTEWNKMAYPTGQLHKPAFGIDLKFQDLIEMTGDSANVYIKHAYVIVDYEVPNYVLTYNRATSQDNPHECGVNDTVCLNATLKNTTKADGGNQTVTITLPPETELVSNSQPMTMVSEGVYSWVCSGKGYASTTNKLCLRIKSFGLKTLSSKLGNAEYPYYIDPRPSEDILIQHGDIKTNEESCWYFNIRTDTSQNTVTYYVDVDGQNRVDYSKVSEKVIENYGLDLATNNDNVLVNWELDQSCAAEGISIVDYTNNSVTFDLIDDNGNHIDNAVIRWRGCFIPLVEGDNTLIVTRQDGGVTHRYTDDYTALDSENTHIAFQIDPIIWYDHRLLFEVDAVGHILPIAVNPFDRIMIEGDCTLKSYKWDEVAYIGCVPVHTSHYDPKSDYSNGLLRESYKNKTYMGKKGEIDEDISLNIKLPPRDWTTLQGLTKLDKPVPINLVPKAFEGDVLNHRGWVELYGVKGVNKTNPLYYDGELEVSYLTHNINTRFSIEKGQDATPATLPSMAITVLESGEEFATYTYLDEDGEPVTNSGYFDVDTDGVYVYDRYSDVEEEEEPEEIDENLRTIITMDNKQHIRIKSNETLPEQADVTLTWNSTKIEENRENNIERIIYLTDDTEKPLFKYQYYDYEFDTDEEYFTCMVSASRLLENDSWEELITKQLLLSVDVESLQLKTVFNEQTGKYELVQEDETELFSDDDDDSDEEEIFTYNDYLYGSTVRFAINGNTLSVTEEGYNGKSISFTTELLPKKYYYDLQFQNLNTDGDTFDVLSFFNFEVAESMITSDYANDYKGMYISSFPIPKKQLLFTRQCDEGTIYYFKDDGSNNFTYIQEPFYMYFCGVDIENQVGSSLFSLDNSYSTFYLDNGLVRLGFNRLNGDLYLSKYDVHSDSYINVAELKATNTDYSIGTFSDDKIEIVAGTTVYTMYRGHPYVVIDHPNEDLIFGTKWTNIWAETVNGDSEDFPIYWDLLNHQNMLPACVGSGDINSNCLEIDSYSNPDVTIKPTLSLTNPSDTIYNNQVSIWTLDGSNDIISEGVIILIDGEVSEVIPVENNVPQKDENDKYILTDLVTTTQFGIIFPDNKEHSVRAVYCGKGNKGIAFTDKITIIPAQYIDPDTSKPLPDGAYKLEIVKMAKDYTYMEFPDWSWRLTKGGQPVSGKLIQRDMPHGSVWTGTTDSKGMVYVNKNTIDLNNEIRLNQFRKWAVGKHEVRARFHQYEDTSLPMLTSVSRTITIKKGTPKMTFAGASKKGNRAKFKLQDPQGYPLAKKKVIIQHGGKRYTKTTNDNGNAYLIINKAGYKTYKVTYAGDSNLKKKTWTFHETVTKK